MRAVLEELHVHKPRAPNKHRDHLVDLWVKRENNMKMDLKRV